MVGVTDPVPLSPEAARAILDWYSVSGIDTAEAVAESDLSAWPIEGFSARRRPANSPAVGSSGTSRAPNASSSSSAPGTSGAPLLPQQNTNALQPADAETVSDADAIAAASGAAAAAPTIAALADAIAVFPHCPLKAGAISTVVYDGVPGAPLLLLGEAPGREEDRQGKPFVGRAGQLLDRMLASIGHSRTGGDDGGAACITNAVYWRPPGNRNPTPREAAICLPFVHRFIALSAPKVIVTLGNVPTQALVPGTPGITRARGTLLRWTVPGGGEIPVMPTFHPAFLLRSPLQKRLAWADLCAVRDILA